MIRSKLTMPLIVAGLTAAGPLAAQGPAFDCAKASHEIEKLICNDEKLAALDRKMEQTYGAAVAAMKDVVDRQQAIQRLTATQSGWIGGRNECWKATDKRQCTEDSYGRRIGELTARYMLIHDIKAVAYECGSSPADELYAYFYPSDPPAVRLERGDSIAAGTLVRAGSGSRYEAESGIVFWAKGDGAQVEWPQGTNFTCRVRK